MSSSSVLIVVRSPGFSPILSQECQEALLQRNIVQKWLGGLVAIGGAKRRQLRIVGFPRNLRLLQLSGRRCGHSIEI